MPYIYRVSRREPARSQPETAGITVSTPEPEPDVSYQEETTELEIPAPEGPSYRDLQGQAKELGISAKQTADDLKKAIAEANGDE